MPLKSKLEQWVASEQDRSEWAATLRQPHVQRMLDAVRELATANTQICANMEANAIQFANIQGYNRALNNILAMEDVGKKQGMDLPAPWTHLKKQPKEKENA